MWSSSSVLEMHGQKIYSLNNSQVSLLQDFHFPTCSHHVVITPSQEYIVSAGVYPPSLHIHSTHDLSLKCARGLKQDCMRICLLEDSYEKILLGCKERWLEVHSAGGEYWKGRSAGFIRDIVYNKFTADAYVAMECGVCGRLGLEEGRWAQEIALNELGEVRTVNVIDGIECAVFAGGEGVGKVSVWDWRQRKGIIDGLNVMRSSVSALCNNGFQLILGDQEGGLGIRDLRMLKDEMWHGEHIYGEEVVRIMKDGEWLISADKVGVRIWNEGKVWTEWEPEGGVNWVEGVKGSGMLLVAGEKEEIGVWFVPGMGMAPRWGMWIEGMTEEMENEGLVVRDEYKFVTEEELEGVDINGLLEKGVVKRYLHGFLMHVKLYQKMRSAKEPEKAEEERKSAIRTKMEANKKDRIMIQSRKPKKINQEYREILEERKDKSGNEKEKISALLDDERFKDMFTKEKYKVDFEAREYIQAHPGVRQKGRNEEEWVQEMQKDNEIEGEGMNMFGKKSIKGRNAPFEQRIVKNSSRNKIVKDKRMNKGKPNNKKRRPFQRDMKAIAKVFA